jgi:hypothetical protein
MVFEARPGCVFSLWTDEVLRVSEAIQGALEGAPTRKLCGEGWAMMVRRWGTGIVLSVAKPDAAQPLKITMSIWEAAEAVGVITAELLKLSTAAASGEGRSRKVIRFPQFLSAIGKRLSRSRAAA